jgi:hypothetical protein
LQPRPLNSASGRSASSGRRHSTTPVAAAEGHLVQESSGQRVKQFTECRGVSVLSKLHPAALPFTAPLSRTGSGVTETQPQACRAEVQRGCAEHVRNLAGVPAIGCDVTSGVSGESREGEQESEQAAGRRADGRTDGTEGGNKQAVRKPARAAGS